MFRCFMNPSASMRNENISPYTANDTNQRRSMSSDKTLQDPIVSPLPQEDVVNSSILENANITQTYGFYRVCPKVKRHRI
jgi:hypothetical protein